MIRLDVPVVPDADEARRWLSGELAAPQYQASKPTWFDLASQAVRDWFAGLFGGGGSGSDGAFAAVLLVLAVAVVVVGIMVFGLPRLNRRAAPVRGVFGEADERTSGDLRRAADAAAGRSDWSEAISERFRAIARTVTERGLVVVLPGTTADEFSRLAGLRFPEQRETLARAARVFDGVRYLDEPGSPADYHLLVGLDDAIAAARAAATTPEAVPA